MAEIAAFWMETELKRYQGAMGTAGFLISILALMIAVSSGTAYAATMITTKNIKNNAVTSAKIANNSVTGAKVKNGTLRLVDFSDSDQRKLLGPRPADAVRVEMTGIYVPANDFTTFTVWCPGSRKVVGGGFFSSIAVASSSAPNRDRSGWVVQVNNIDNGIDIEADGYAICS